MALIPLNLKKMERIQRIAPPVCLVIISTITQCLTSPCAPFPECLSTEAWPWRRSSVLDLIWITLWQVSLFQALLNCLQLQWQETWNWPTTTHILLFSLPKITHFYNTFQTNHSPFSHKCLMEYNYCLMEYNYSPLKSHSHIKRNTMVFTKQELFV